MPVQYRTYGRNRVKVSRRWLLVLREADRDKVGFTINSGHRSMEQQQALFNQNMLRPGVPRPGRPLTAVPSRTAPHIRTGRADHALDINSLDGGETRLQRWLERHSVNTSNPVRGESWHLEANARDLERLARRIQRRNARRRKAKAKPKPKPRAKKPPPPRPPTRLDAAGERHLIGFEGEVLYAYNDLATLGNPNPPNGNATFGVGHLLHKGPVTSSDRHRFGTREHPHEPAQMRALSRQLLRKDVRRFEQAVLEHVPVRWRRSQDRFTALVSVSFNLGPEVLTPDPPLTSLGQALQGLSAAKIAEAILLYDKAGNPPRTMPGLVRRRRAEAALFLRNR